MPRPLDKLMRQIDDICDVMGNGVMTPLFKKNPKKTGENCNVQRLVYGGQIIIFHSNFGN